ncbi:hypothetical protein CR513_41988, partial [Mucuna pruriens]
QQSSIKTIPLLFPSRVVQARKFEINDELLQTFNKVEIKIPLLDTIKQIPKYTKFLKELCTNKKKKLKGDVKVGRNVFALTKSEQVYALIQPTMPKKCSDLDTFFVPCTIGKCNFNVMSDLGTSINVMPSSIYKSLRLDILEPSHVVTQLANKSIVDLLGILEDVLVQISMLDGKDELSSKRPTLILCRPFLKTS